MADLKYLTVSLSAKDIVRISSKISVDIETGCWNWTGQIDKGGYGIVSFNGHSEKIHRLVYAWKNGPIPKGQGAEIQAIDHIVCNNRRCCNPDHLRLALPRENSLRSNSAPAINARKTHCVNGHLLPPKIKGKERRCPVCTANRYEEQKNDPDYIERHREYSRRHYIKIRGK